MKSTLNIKSPASLQNSMTDIIQLQNKILGNEKLSPDQEDNMILATAKTTAKESTTRENIESTTLKVGSTVTQMEFSTITTVKTTSTKDYDEDYENNLNCSDHFDMGFR